MSRPAHLASALARTVDALHRPPDRLSGPVMPVYPLAWVPFSSPGPYPHMAKHDARIWERFRARYAGYFQDAAYDIGLGGSETTDPQATPAERLGWRYNTAKRID